MNMYSFKHRRVVLGSPPPQHSPPPQKKKTARTARTATPPPNHSQFPPKHKILQEAISHKLTNFESVCNIAACFYPFCSKASTLCIFFYLIEDERGGHDVTVVPL